MFYICQFLNEYEIPIYIGITGNIKTRINNQHFGSSGHLSEECYSEVYMVLYSECVSEDDAKIKERYFINILSPKYNEKLNNGSLFSFSIGDLEWLYMPINKDNLFKKRPTNNKKTIENIDYEYKQYKSLKFGPIKCFKKIPCKAITLLEVNSPFVVAY